MNRVVIGALVAVGVVVLIVGLSATFTVHQSEQALVLQFGEPRRVVIEPGLQLKVPFVQNVLVFEKRVLDYNAPTQEIPTLDQKQVLVDAFAKFRIVNPLEFYQTVRNLETMRDRLGAIISSNLRQALGRIAMQEILTAGRADMMEEITAKVSQEAESFGIEVLDVRMRRVDLPEENSQAIFRRMQTQREQEARRIRAEGARESQTIRAEADKQQVVIVANARRQSEISRGEGDGTATAIYNEAYGRDASFFDFYRSMQAMVAGLPSETTTYVGPPSGEFFRYFLDSEAGLLTDGPGADVPPDEAEQTSSAEEGEAEAPAAQAPADEPEATIQNGEAVPVVPGVPGTGSEALPSSPAAEEPEALLTPEAAPADEEAAAEATTEAGTARAATEQPEQ